MLIQTLETSPGLYRVALRDCGGLARDLRAAVLDRRPRLRLTARGETTVTPAGLAVAFEGSRLIVEAHRGQLHGVQVPHTLVTLDPGPQLVTWARAVLAVRPTRTGGELDPTWASLAALSWTDVPEVAA
ncbi:MAG: hypothetical protein R3F60_14815 [bacterium]